MIGHLVSDWLPWVPDEARNSVFGWPEFLLDRNDSGCLVMNQSSEKMERQWKGFFSWLLGVIGTRHFLHREGYRWIAHMSAFYEEAHTPVGIDEWHAEFPPSVLKARRPTPRQLRPDYIALRQRQDSPGDYDWAVVEAKGTSQAIYTKEECPEKWKAQSENIELLLPNEGLPVPRNLVVATRGNSSAKRPMTRRIQIRAWNQVRKEPSAPQEMVALVVAAHLFGLLRTFSAHESARELGNAVRRWSKPEKSPSREKAYRSESRKIHAPCDPGGTEPRFEAGMRDRAWDLVKKLIEARDFQAATGLIAEHEREIEKSEAPEFSSYGIKVTRLKP